MLGCHVQARDLPPKIVRWILERIGPVVDLGEVVEAIQNAPDADTAFRRFSEALECYGYTNAVYTLMNDHHSIGQQALHGFATSYPEDWLQHYNEKKYHRFDPAWQGALSKSAPFFWADAVKEQAVSRSANPYHVQQATRVMNEASDAGLADGISMSFTNTLGEIVGIGASRSHVEPRRNYRDFAEVHLICALFHQTFMGFFPSVEPPRVTVREQDVLSWSAEGKSDVEIAELMGITTHTVRFHWNNIFRKLHVRSKIQATIIAVQRRIVSPRSVGSSIK